MTARDPKTESSPGLARVHYRPPASYRLDLEVLPVSEWRRRVARSGLLRPHRIEFHQLLCITRGTCAHTVDFEPVAAAAGSVFALRPAQAQQFDDSDGWDGWLLVFRPEFLLPLASAMPADDLKAIVGLETLPAHLTLAPDERDAVAECIARMYRDAGSDNPAEQLHALLRHQLYALLLRLHFAQGRRVDAADAFALRRFERFRREVEVRHSRCHRVSDYTRAVGCSEKTLTRTTLAIAGVTAKSYIAARIALEAKRLLAHTTMPVAAIADRLGFDEATNFVKFFRRVVGCVPGAFRRRQSAS
jgi:AraC-like DNA-binding protein